MVLSYFRKATRGRDEPSSVQSVPEAYDSATSEASLARVNEPALAGKPAAAPPDAAGFVAYTWLLNGKKQVIGYRLRWLPHADHARSDALAQLHALVNTLTECFFDAENGWTMGNVGLSFDVTPENVAALYGSKLPAKNVVLCWQSQDFSNPDIGETLVALRQKGFALLLCGEPPEDKELRKLVTHFDVGAGDAQSLETCRSLTSHVVNPIATRMDGWNGFEACAAKRVPVLVAPDQEPPALTGTRPPLQPETLLLVRLLQMVQRNDDVRVIEAALKHDVALTYRFLRHINSPAVGAGVEIHSLRHAVAMLGYTRLFRWLSMLLATSDVKSSPPYLARQALVRGRFVELLGTALIGPKHADNLFLVGMFSVLDQLLGVPMTELFERVQLADSVRAAIVDQAGMYGPFLSLAIACESGADEMEALAEALFLTPTRVNTAHLGALVWAYQITRAETAR